MLVLSRKEGECIHIGTIVLTVLRMKGSQVCLGLDAPYDVRIIRGEIRDHPRPRNFVPNKPKSK